MTRRTSRAVKLCQSLACFVAILGLVRLAPAAEQGKEQKFLRFVEDNEGGGRLETAIATYVNPAGVKVHLVAAVHVGDKKYYQGLSSTFAGYDALLYEMIKPRGAEPPQPGVRSDSTLSMFQRMLTDVLELQFQLDAIDYSKKNFIHADLDAETFARLQEERGESLITLMLRAMLAEMQRPQAQNEDISLTELLVALTSPDRARHFKLILGRQFEDIEEKVAGLQGPTGTVLLTERNKAAIATLKKTIAAGRKDIGIFYGAAHMSDMSERLKDMGFSYQGTEWRTAWDMTPKPGDTIFKTYKGKPETQPAN